jgi:hypothetical protein
MVDDDEAIIRAAMALLAYDENIQLESVMAQRWHRLTREAREDYYDGHQLVKDRPISLSHANCTVATSSE